MFSYQLPFNIVAVIVMLPMSYILNPRWFHKLNGESTLAPKLTAVFMIRASNFPVLVAIALYERQQYSESSLMERLGDFVERYIGSLPRKLKAAGKSRSSRKLIVAGFDNFGSRHDFDMVFEIEREVGSFYRGWDDDAEDDLQLPPAFDEEDFTAESPDKDQHNDTLYAQPNTAPLTASPSAVHFSRETESAVKRDRRNSMPSTSSRSGSPAAAVLPVRDLPAFRPRRNSSIHEPSPLARLFVRASGDQTEVIDRLRERRQSLIGLAMPASQSQPMLASLVSPRGRAMYHKRTDSQPAAPKPLPKPEPEELPKRPIPQPFIPPIEEGKKLSFVTPHRTPATSRPGSPAPTGSRRGGMPFPLRDGSSSAVPTTATMTGSGFIGKASDLEARESDMGGSVIKRDEEDAGWRERLEAIEEGQKRIEDMLEKLLNGTVKARK